MWQPDGWARTRIGILTPHTDVWPEAEFGAMAPDGISIHAARAVFACRYRGIYRVSAAPNAPSSANTTSGNADCVACDSE